ncbi:MAG: crossover junction endodeoxyribonuclease RuvC [Deltaproteobacteria bacterium]|nr:crossover junction endodeoxyribonuclease RuvC [Deltaproteobacteria bacterium]MBW2016524.1 crossover junction endodeoxyribonuclease RuvC [Deltaproteobacteria bacterium]MBW2128281.1 crossover junction endodeoxyribonuclease RuvC [Deltaproteobacteria bacterium]MBW2302276.1 crossover junction endodeoxyribonuclease RuvC [Deltaproteobacteria bacterium]
MLVLGVDPGSLTTGFGLVEKKKNRMTCVHAGTVTASSKIPFHDRIHYIFRSMVEIMTRYRPQELAIEDMFFAKNVKSALKIGHARGAVLIGAVQCGLKIYEYSPLEIKKSVVGYGRATKEQVRSMVQTLLQLRGPLNLDTSDALAAAICHIHWMRFESSRQPDRG